jgi:hypothetical protein
MTTCKGLCKEHGLPCLASVDPKGQERNIYQEAILTLVWYNETVSEPVEIASILGGVLSDVSTYESGHPEKMVIIGTVTTG